MFCSCLHGFPLGSLLFLHHTETVIEVDCLLKIASRCDWVKWISCHFYHIQLAKYTVKKQCLSRTMVLHKTTQNYIKLHRSTSNYTGLHTVHVCKHAISANTIVTERLLIWDNMDNEGQCSVKPVHNSCFE